MATVKYIHPISEITGKLAKGDKVIHRTRNGVQEAYVITHPYEGEPSEAQRQQRSRFYSINQQAKSIYADPAQRAEWQARFEAFISTREYRKALEAYLAQQRAPQRIPYIPKQKIPKPPTTLYGFILSSLSKE